MISWMKYILSLAFGTLAMALFVTTAMAAQPTYKVITKIKIGGAPRWDYVYVDSANHRLYVSHATQTEVVDTTTDKVIATIPDTAGVHGIAVANDLGKGFTSNGTSNNVTIFDLKTSKATGTVNTGQNPDSIIYEPVTHRVFTFNGKSKDSTVFDGKTGEIVSASLPLGGKPEFAQVDGKGHVYANIEDKNEIIEINAKDATVAKRYSIAPCDGPSGLAINPKGILFSVCDGKVMVVSDPAAGKVLATPAIGSGVDGVAYDDGYAFSANGGDGNITMVAKHRPVSMSRLRPSRRSAARARSARTRKLTSFICRPRSTDLRRRRRMARRGVGGIADSFEIIVVGR